MGLLSADDLCLRVSIRRSTISLLCCVREVVLFLAVELKDVFVVAFSEGLLGSGACTPSSCALAAWIRPMGRGGIRAECFE